MQQIYSENSPPFHMYNLGKAVDAYSKPRRIPKVVLFAITALNSFKSLTVFTISSPPQMFDSALNSSLQNVVHNEYHV